MKFSNARIFSPVIYTLIYFKTIFKPVISCAFNKLVPEKAFNKFDANYWNLAKTVGSKIGSLLS